MQYNFSEKNNIVEMFLIKKIISAFLILKNSLFICFF